MNKPLLYLFSMLLLLGVASAGTVTLTGSCRTLGLDSMAMNFTLSNSGNDSAYNLVVTPMLQNVQAQNNVYILDSLGPDSRNTLTVNVTGLTERGVSAGYFITTYQQGTEVFSAVFPCLYAFGNMTQSQILMTPHASIAHNGNATVVMSVYNAGPTTISANVSLILPPALTYIGGRSYQVDVNSGSFKNVTFNLLFKPSLSASFSVASFATYVQGNLSHASLSSFVLSSPSVQQSPFTLIITIIAAVIVIAIIALIISSMMKKRKKAAPVPTAPAPAQV
jgi:hypothetical protein